MPGHDSIEDAVQYVHACCEQVFHFSPKISAAEVTRDFQALAKATRPIVRGERGILSMFKPKTAALLADRVWFQYPGQQAELDFAFGWQSPKAIRLAAFMAFAKFSGLLDSVDSGAFDNKDLARTSEFLVITHRELADEYARITGAAVTPMYASTEARDHEQSRGTDAVIVSVIEEVAMVHEDSLSWEQVTEFRKDVPARSAYRRFIHWLDREMLNKPTSYVLDELHGRLEDYSWALRKHGLQVVIGTLQRTVDLKGLIGSATAALALESLTRLPLLSLLAGAGVAVGNAAIHVATALIERKELAARNPEVAFVHELRTRLGSKAAG